MSYVDESLFGESMVSYERDEEAFFIFGGARWGEVFEGTLVSGVELFAHLSHHLGGQTNRKLFISFHIAYTKNSGHETKKTSS